MEKNFLLSTKTARKLYHKVARDLPIIDYHNHLSISDVANDRRFSNITELWITPDPYKHRAMRILGVPEKYITGDASDFEKFEEWYNLLPRLVGNPLYDWSRMELSTVFGIELSPIKVSAIDAWNVINEKLKSLSAKKILEKFNIEYSAPCASLCDDLSLYESVMEFAPSLRTDDIFAFDPKMIERLSKQTSVTIYTTGLL